MKKIKITYDEEEVVYKYIRETAPLNTKGNPDVTKRMRQITLKEFKKHK